MLLHVSEPLHLLSCFLDSPLIHIPIPMCMSQKLLFTLLPPFKAAAPLRVLSRHPRLALTFFSVYVYFVQTPLWNPPLLTFV